MAIDYIIDAGCEVKRKLTTEGLLAMIKEQGRARAILEMCRKDGLSEEEALQQKIRFCQRTPEGDREVMQTLSEIIERARPLEELAEHCEKCMVHNLLWAVAGSGERKPEAFECIRMIHYPISKNAEEWLARLAEEAVLASDERMDLISQITAGSIEMLPLAAMRADPHGTFFELRKPLMVTVKKSLLGRKTVSTDQLLGALFAPGPMDHNRIEPSLLFSGGFFKPASQPGKDECQVALCITAGDHKIWFAFNLRDSPGDDTSTFELKQYFRSLYVALVTGQTVVVIP